MARSSIPALAEPVARLASALGFPLLADPLSLVRCGPHDRDAVIDSYDAFLRDLPTVTGSKSVGEDLVSSRGSQAPDAREDTRSSPTADNNRIVSSWLDLIGEHLKPDVVLRFGAMPTSKPVLLFLQRFPDAKHVVIGEGWEDPMLLASRMVNADPRRTCEGLVKRVAGKPRGRAWLETWKRIDDVTRQAITEVVGDVQEPFEGRVFAELGNLLPDGATLWASSSMPVRDLDTFFPGNERRLTFLSNRGANGIDGVISSALGASTVSEGPLVLTIGDIAFYHDMNGLLAAKLHGLNATIILINNDGGGIFSFLPQATHGEHFEDLFGTPHGLDFRPAAEMYGASYHLMEGWDDFRQSVSDALRRAGPQDHRGADRASRQCGAASRRVAGGLEGVGGRVRRCPCLT